MHNDETVILVYKTFICSKFQFVNKCLTSKKIKYYPWNFFVYNVTVICTGCFSNTSHIKTIKPEKQIKFL